MHPNFRSELFTFLALSAFVSGCPAPSQYEAVLECTNTAANNEKRIFCVQAAAICWNSPIPTEGELCSWAWYGDVNHIAVMNPVVMSEKAESCELLVAAGKHEPNSGHSHFPGTWEDQKGENCVGPGGNYGSTSEGATSNPTTGAATDSTTSDGTSGSSTTGDTGGENDGPGKYYCSLRSNEKCADLLPDNWIDPDGYPNLTTYDACWPSVPELDPNKPKVAVCVNSDNLADALGDCEKLCGDRRDDIVANCEAPGCDLIRGLDCVLGDGTWTDANGNVINNDPQEGPKKVGLVSGWRCEGEPLVIGEGPYWKFEGSGTFITPDGVTAGASGVRGTLSYKLSDCTPATCVVTIDTLVGITPSMDGGYTDAAGNGGTFAARGMGFQSRAPFIGEWNKSRGTVSFADATLLAHFWAQTAEIDGATVVEDFGPYGIEIMQMVGSLDAAQGPLSLSFSYHISSAGTVSVVLRTLPTE